MRIELKCMLWLLLSDTTDHKRRPRARKNHVSPGNSLNKVIARSARRAFKKYNVVHHPKLSKKTKQVHQLGDGESPHQDPFLQAKS
ncbi:hypothetical protein LshimejAT787_0401260 [Lyophyllum shimeji]|uniref:Uncharacterized protein n=1 Tax=Lyophyllum shimeji TaxID=47721 RepID=A0A9P3UMS1_LYOSH|nr:hypothetical protein LshimejAT787_0401260 [Lyophyllum shimeji]